eukprot:m.10121 g.10121  ORF g.10121 m.10121 type:complete len:558 (+) comp6523_c1_seq1:59-1732(+)
MNIEGLAHSPQEHVKHCGVLFPPGPSHEEFVSHPFFTVMRNGFKSVHRDFDAFQRILVEAGSSDLPVEAVDPITGCTSLHYICKAGGRNEQEDESAAKLAADLIRNGADTNKQCLFRGMTPIMYASFFHCPRVLDVLLRSSGATGQININAVCEKWDDFTALHFAVKGGNVNCVKVLLAARASTEFMTTNKERPLELAKNMLASPSEFDNRIALEQIVKLLEKETDARVAFRSPKPPLEVPPTATLESVPKTIDLIRSPPQVHFHDEVSDTSSVFSSVMGEGDDVIHVGDRVEVDGGKGQGLVRFKGLTQFKKGTWYGVQLDKPFGKNNGTVAMVTYFKTKPKHGVMVRRGRLTKLGASAPKRGPVRKNPKKKAPHKSGKSPAPFTAPTFRAQKSIRPDAGQAKSPSKYTFTHQSQGFGSFRNKNKLGSLRKEVTASPLSGEDVIRKKASTLRSTPRSHAQRPKNTSAPLGPLMEPFGIHSRVLAKGAVGTVQSIGPCDLGEGVFIGVAFSKEMDDGHDGTVDGKRYFTCAPKKGLLLPASKVHWHGHRVDKVLQDE